MTGLRISDVQNLKRSNFMDNYVSFVKKSKKDQSLWIWKLVKLWITSLCYSKRSLPTNTMMSWKDYGYPKNSKESYLSRSQTHLCYKFLERRPSGETQRLLGHSDIKQTMIYVHIVQADANAEIFLLDNLF
jgi:integrase